MGNIKYYKFDHNNSIPENYIKDVESLRMFMYSKMNIFLSIQDTYLLWDKISDDWDASWLDINSQYDDRTREEFLLDYINKYCVCKGELY